MIAQSIIWNMHTRQKCWKLQIDYDYDYEVVNTKISKSSSDKIYIYNNVKNYKVLYQISTFYKIISHQILHLQTPLLSTILQY